MNTAPVMTITTPTPVDVAVVAVTGITMLMKKNIQSVPATITIANPTVAVVAMRTTTSTNTIIAAARMITTMNLNTIIAAAVMSTMTTIMTTAAAVAVVMTMATRIRQKASVSYGFWRWLPRC